ncbi:MULTISPECIES: cytochrome c peroxidase [unclassified Sediminibacterium]|jgi:cytochrome c peroxidase|uniref:cytochrome-c peroxidase n=1 Tax=unclassified Sediminibacterium TaxID=2635961 RepID=UPI0025F9AAF6|nr:MULTISPECIES: cytochrome c peroxidase [unclassified Sediminibacterium]
MNNLIVNYFYSMKRTAGCIVLLVGGIAAISAFMAPAPVTTKAALGKKLFNDKILSKDNTISCASCHLPEYGFSDTVAFSKGIEGRATTRNTPSVLNMKNRPYFFWDGRAASLEQQALMPIAHPDEMGLPIQEAVARLNASSEYRKLFLRIFKALPNSKNLGAAFAAFERTLETDSSRFDAYMDDLIAFTESEERGRKLFISDKTKCFDCHRGPDFTDDQFKNIGLFDGYALNDSGRYLITRKKEDLGKFKTPGLRNIALTAPYMHNGMFQTLEEVVEYYNNPGAFVLSPINIDSTLAEPLSLSRQEKADLVAFLKTLTDKRFQKQR